MLLLLIITKHFNVLVNLLLFLTSVVEQGDKIVESVAKVKPAIYYFQQQILALDEQMKVFDAARLFDPVFVGTLEISQGFQKINDVTNI